MADEKESEEYQFQDEGAGEESVSSAEASAAPEAHDESYEAAADETAAAVPRRGGKGKVFLIVIGLVVAIFVVYQFLGVKKQPAPGVKQVQKVKPAVLLQAKAKPIRTVVPISPSTEQVLQTNQRISRDLKAMQEKRESDRQQLLQLQGTLNRMQSSMSMLNGRLSRLHGSLATTATDVGELVAAHRAAELKKLRERMPIKRSYHVVAMVPGRAWLESSDGLSRSVKVGDMLGGYGRIRMISPRRGVVATSSGTVLQYGFNDS